MKNTWIPALEIEQENHMTSLAYKCLFSHKSTQTSEESYVHYINIIVDSVQLVSTRTTNIQVYNKQWVDARSIAWHICIYIYKYIYSKFVYSAMEQK